MEDFCEQDSPNLGKDDLVRLPYFDWDKAKYFYYVAKLGSFSETGKFLNISQSSLSRKTRILEDNLNCKLFTRVPKGVELTRKGQELFVIVERAFLDLKGFNYNSTVTANNGQQRKIRISATHADAAYMFNDLIHDYNKLRPELIFEIIVNDQLVDIFLNDVDIAIRPYDPAAQGVQQEPLFTLEKCLYASREYLEKYGEPQTVGELKSHHLIAFGHPEMHPYADVSWILRLGMLAGKFHNPIFTSNSIECLIGAAKKGRGIIASYEKMTIIKEANLKKILPHVSLKEKEGYFVYPDYLKKDPEIIEIKQYLYKRLSEQETLRPPFSEAEESKDKVCLQG